MIKEVLTVIGVLLGFIGYAPYIRDTIRGTTRPHVYTWFAWGMLSSIIFALQLSDEGGVGSFITLAVALISFLIFFLALRQGKKDIATIDTVVMVVAFIGLGFWLIAKQPVISVLLVVGVDVLAFLPTIRKSWNKPHQETLISYLIAGFRHGLGVFALQRYTFITVLFPVTWTVVNVLFVIMLLVRRRSLHSTAKS